MISERMKVFRNRLKTLGTIHGLASNGTITKEYRCWRNIITRCCDPKHNSFKNYGGRGIRVCDRWKHSVTDFISDVGLAPSPRHSIERIETDGNYEPGNCRWATKSEQNRNKRGNRIIEWQGKKLCLIELAELSGLKFSTLHARLERGWSIEEAVKPTRYRRKAA